MKISITTMLFLATVALGCSKKEENADNKAPTTEPATAKVVEPPAATIPGAAAATPAAVPTVADFEADAIKNISDETLEKELSAIEKELGE
jgi:PBP1b-binding outer membrane lipoprotein LpoB